MCPVVINSRVFRSVHLARHRVEEGLFLATMDDQLQVQDLSGRPGNPAHVPFSDNKLKNAPFPVFATRIVTRPVCMCMSWRRLQQRLLRGRT